MMRHFDMKKPSPHFMEYLERKWTEYHGPFDCPASIPDMPPAFLRGALYALEYKEPEKMKKKKPKKKKR
jgi:hypothetical protein